MGCLVEDAPVRTATADYPELVVEWLPVPGPSAAGGDWCDITAYTASIESGGGRQYEVGNFQASDMTVTLKEAGRLFDEENTAGPFYPHLRTLKQIRWSAVWDDALPGGVTLDGTGDYISTPDAAAWNVSGVIRVVVRMSAPDWTPAASGQIIGHWRAANGSRGWAMFLNSDGDLLWFVSADGTANTLIQASDAPVLVDGTTYWIGVEYDTDTGALTFYKADDALNLPTIWSGWTEVSTHSVTAAVPFDSVERLTVGAQGNGVSSPLAMTLYAASVYDDGTQIASPDFTTAGDPTAELGAATYTDAQDNVWTLQGDAEIAGLPRRYPMWHGFITDFGDATPDDALFEQTITAKDGFLILDQIGLTKTWFELEVEKDGPSHWWYLDEPGDATNPLDLAPVDSETPTVVGFYSNGLPELGVQAIVAYDGGRTCTSWDGTTGSWINLPAYAPDSNTPGFTIEGWFQLDAADLPATSSVYPLCWFGVFDALDPTDYTRVQVDMYGSTAVTPGEIGVSYNAAGLINTAFSGVNLADGETHHFVATLNVTTAEVGIYIDGELLDTDSSAHSVGWIGAVSANGNYRRGAIGTGYFTSARLTFPGIQSHVVVYEGNILSADRVADHYAAGSTAFSGDKTGERVERMLDYYGWPALLRDIDTGTAILGAHDLPSGSLLSYLQSLSGTEIGAMFMNPENRLAFRGRYANYTETRSTTSQATFGDGHSSSLLKYVQDGFSLRRDEAQIHNPVTASRQGGVSFTAEDTALSDPETGYGRRDWQAPTSLERDDGAMSSRAHWLLERGKDPEPRLANMTIRPRRAVELWPATLGLANQDRVTVERTPLGIAPQESVDQWIESIKHKASPKVFETSVVGAPADDTEYLVVGVGLVGTGRVG